MHGLHFNHYFCTDHSNATEEKKAPRHVLLWQCDIIVFAAVQLLPSPVISKELDVLLAMVAALRSELDEVQLLPIVSSFAAVILSADLWSFSVDSFQDCAFIKLDGCH